MVYSDFPLFYVAAVVGASSIALFLSIKEKRDGNLKSLSFLLLDFVIVVLLPLILATLTSVPSAVLQRLFISGFLFYLVIGAIYFLFTSTARRLLIPSTSVYLLLVVLMLPLNFLYDGYGFTLTLYAYYLLDEIDLATLSALFLAILLPLCRQVSSKIGILLESRHLGNIASATEARHSSSERRKSNKNEEAHSLAPSNSPLRNAVNLFRAGRYRQSIESCDTEIERIILSRLAELYSTKIDMPMSLRDQLSKLMSKGAPVAREDILQLRDMRNGLTMSSGEATAHQAKWAIRVMRRTKRALESSPSGSSSMESQGL